MTQWAFAIDEVLALADEPIALIEWVGLAANEANTRVQRSALRRRVLTKLAAIALDLPEGVRLAVGADGHRYLHGTKIFASVAHRDGWAAAVLWREPVGIDIESMGEADAAAQVILGGIDAGTDVASWGGLAGIWAAREAVLKAQGCDLTRDHARWRFGDGLVRGGDVPALRVDTAACPDFVAAVAYAGD